MSSMAAANWYHNRAGKPDLETFFEEAHRFTADEYLPALFRGDELSAAERTHVIERMAYYTGLKPAFLEARRMRVDIRDFLSHLLEDSNEYVGMYDAALQMEGRSPTSSPSASAATTRPCPPTRRHSWRGSGCCAGSWASTLTA